MKVGNMIFKKKRAEIDIDISKNIKITKPDKTKSMSGNEIDYIYNKDNIKLTYRFIPNGDIFIYYEYTGPSRDFCIQLPKINKEYSFDSLYKKPKFSNRYGENKLTGFYKYIDLNIGSMVLSKLISVKKLEKIDGSNKSVLYNLIKEESALYIDINNILYIPFRGDKKAIQSGFVLFSNKKLFKDINNLEKYMNYYYNGLENNSVWCSFFMMPDGTYTKLPYSIEPFTKDGYGYSLQHSSRKDMIPFAKDTKERFFDCFIANAIYQAFLYQNQYNGMFVTPFTSTWLKKDTNIEAPYVDSRLNENFIAMVQDFQKINSWFDNIELLKNYADFWYDLYINNYIYELKDSDFDAAFFPDYFKENCDIISHTSLNHQIGICLTLLKAYDSYQDKNHLLCAKLIINAISTTADRWINPENGDLFYGMRIKDNSIYFFDKDYIYVTLYDLLKLQQYLVQSPIFEYSKNIERMIDSKINYLKSTEFDLFNNKSEIPNGEPQNLKKLTLELYKKIYNLK